MKTSASRSFQSAAELDYGNHPDDQGGFPGPALLCRICKAHYIIPKLMTNGKLVYKCPMGHWWYDDASS